MIGSKQIVYSANQFISGQASSDYAPDGGLGANASNLNPFVTPGVLRGNLISSDVNSILADNVIATSEDGTGGLKARLMVGDAANYYTVDTSGTIVKVATGTDTSNYVYGRTDVAVQSGSSGNKYAFVTHGTDITLWNGSTSITENWWSTIAYYTGTTHPPALTANPHPLLNFNTNLWVADGSQLHNILPNVAFTTATLAVNLSVLSLDAFSTIYALGTDPTTGLMLISFQNTVNQGDTISTQAFVGLYDGYSTGLRRKIPVDDLVTAFKNVGGQVYCMFGPKVGVWNGNGITFLRKLTNVTNSTSSLNYQHRVANNSNVLLVADGNVMLGYGEPMAGKPKTWFNMGTLVDTSNTITALCPLGNNKVGVFARATSLSKWNLRTYDLSSASGTTFTASFALQYFPKPIFVRRMRVITTGIANTGATDMVVSIGDDKGGVLPISNASRIVSVPAGTTYVVDFDFGGAKCQAVQPNISASNGAWGLVQVIIYYDPAE